MPRKLAIDWDDVELRLVAAQCSGSNIKVNSVDVIPIENDNVAETLQAVIKKHGFEKTDTLIAIGRGKAELRELQLPPVPHEELPDMVRFQAIRSFASAGDSATVDFLVTDRNDEGVSMLAAAVGPDVLDEIDTFCDSAELIVKRVALRPLAAASLYLNHRKIRSKDRDTVLIDLLADDAEIVVARDGRVIFVRTVRMPTGSSARATALAGELRRSLMACGASDTPNRVILWGRESVHRDEIEKISQATGTETELLDPFELVDVDAKLRGKLPDHVGRLAPLIGLLASDEVASERLIDFLNPRKRPEEPPDRLRKSLLVGVPIAAVLLLGFLAYRRLSTLDQTITLLQKSNAALKKPVEMATESLARTERVDQFLDGDVVWLNEIRDLAAKMPPADEMIVRSFSASTDIRKNGGGKIVISGAVTKPDVIDDLENAIRDDNHQVVGDGSKFIETDDAYRWSFRQTITIPADKIRNDRYAALGPNQPTTASQESSPTEADSNDDASAESASESAPNAAADEREPDEEIDPDPNVDPSDDESEEVQGDEETVTAESNAAESSEVPS